MSVLPAQRKLELPYRWNDGRRPGAGRVRRQRRSGSVRLAKQFARGFPYCRATIDPPATGYKQMIGWVQMVNIERLGGRVSTSISSNRSATVPHPFTFFGYSPPCSIAPTPTLPDWDFVAHTFLCGLGGDPARTDRKRSAGKSGPCSASAGGSRSAGAGSSSLEPAPLSGEDWNRHLALSAPERSPSGTGPSRPGFFDAPAAVNAAAARRRMVERQLRARGIEDERVLAAMAEVPREAFVPASSCAAAPTPTRPCRSARSRRSPSPGSSPRSARRCSCSGSELVLEVGTGSGYSAAVLSLLASHVVSVERHRGALARRGRGAGVAGRPQRRAGRRRRQPRRPRAGPFDAIAVHATAPAPPPALLGSAGRGRPPGRPDRRRRRRHADAAAPPRGATSSASRSVPAASCR